jgi:hypothetical protein
VSIVNQDITALQIITLAHFTSSALAWPPRTQNRVEGEITLANHTLDKLMLPELKRHTTCHIAIVVFGVALSILSDSVLAQTTAGDGSVVYVVAKVKDEKKKVTEELAQATASANALAAAQTQAEQKRDDIDHRARLFNDSGDSQKLGNDVGSYKATCEGQRLYGADISRCNNAAASITGRLAQHNETMTSLKTQFDDQDAVVQQKKNEQVLAQARITKLRNYLSWLTTADDKLTTVLAKSCANTNGTIEELKHRCGNIQFDAAAADLPACETERCQAWTIYTKAQRTPEQAIQDYKNSGQQNPAPPPHLDNRPVPAPSQPN